jgi:glycosyltransferase involved in cell wall biosynthesis
MQVLHVHSGNLYGGLETFLVTLAREQRLVPGLRHQFALCWPGRLSDELWKVDAPVDFLGETSARRPAQVLAARRRLGEVLRERRPDVVVCHSVWVQALFGSVARRSELQLAFWVHMGLTKMATSELWSFWLARFTRPDLAICDSLYTMSTLPSLYPNVDAHVLYYPVSASEQADNSRDELRRQFGATPDDKVIIQTSRLEPWKGHRLHLHALARLRDLPGWVCWMTGGAQRPKEQTYLRELQDLADKLGIQDRVRFLGQRSDVPQLLRAADIHCQPNTGPEPFGIAFVEALYAGIPVVTTALGGALEIVDETCGILVKPDDDMELAQALRKLIQNPALRNRLAAGGPARARGLCGPAAQIEKLRSILDELRKGFVAA